MRIFCFLIAVFVPFVAFSKEHHVRVVSDYDNVRMYFQPKELTIRPGDTVIWTNEADEHHNIVTYPDGFPKGAKPLHSPYMTKAGETFSYKFEKAGTYDYHCIPHVFMGMHGTVVVGKRSGSDGFHVPSAEEVLSYREEMLKFFDEEDFEHAPHYVKLRKDEKKPGK